MHQPYAPRLGGRRPRGGVKDIGSGFILEFRDPGIIALELQAPKPTA
ncbi:hypothetical protein [Subtercola boreus]|nr:hypothetical protein [Subtercola boreus]